jgi:hypothetical protein
MPGASRSSARSKGGKPHSSAESERPRRSVEAVAQPLAAVGERDAAAAAQEQRRAHRGGQPPQRRADRRLGEVEAPGGLGDPAGLRHHREDAQEVQIEIAAIVRSMNTRHVFYVSYSLD